MHDPDAEVSGRVSLARDLLVTIFLDVRVVHPGQGYVETAGGEPPPLIIEIQPAGRAHVIAELLPRQVRTLWDVPAGTRTPQVSRRVNWLRCIQVIRAEYEDAGPVKQRPQGINEGPNGLWMRDGIPGIDDHVGVEVVEGPDPGQESLPPGGEMRIGKMQHAHWLRARCQDGNLIAAQGEPVPLDHRGVADGGRAERSGDRDKSSHFHLSMVP